MKTARYRRGGRAIAVAGTALTLYLALLVAVGYVGQVRLRDSLMEQERLAVGKQAVALAYFLNDQNETLRELAGGRSIQAFLANRDLGMSMRYGLRASLLAVSRDLKGLVERKRVHGAPVFGRLAFCDRDGRVLVEVGDHVDASTTPAYGVRTPGAPGSVQLVRHPAGTLLALTAPVTHKERAAGFLAAEIDAERVLGPFLASSGNGNGSLQTALVGPNDEIVVAGDAGQHGTWPQAVGDPGRAPLQEPVAGTGLRLLSLPTLQGAEGILTSPLFLASLALFSLPLLGGIVFLLRLNSHNLVLQARSDAVSQQRAILRRQNERLQMEINKRVRSEEQLAYQANYDQLTALPNRHLALDRLAQAIKWAKRDGGSVIILFLDLDRFKQVNDSLGHAAGDELLREAAKRLLSRVRDSDTVSRLGGDEFLLICPEETPDPNGDYLAQQLLKAMSLPFYIGDHEFFVGASIGVAAYPEGGTEPAKLLRAADIAMYAAKQRGRNRYAFYDPSMDAMAVEAVRLEHNLRHAIERDEFAIVFQPIVDLSSGATVAVEALLRWNNAEFGAVTPDRFIPIAEETGLIHDIGEWVLVEACRAVSALHPPPELRVAVNLSSKQFSRPARVLDCVLYALQVSGLMPNQLELEITESLLIDDRSEIATLLDQLDRIGVRLSIDDFGTGYSALNYLQRFPFDVLKIDRSFTSQVPDSEASVSLIRAIIAMAHALDLEVIAEGIENRAQAGFLLVQHCEYGQGFHYSRPLSAEQLRAHLAGERAQSA